jgi:hypothetical protein
MKQALQKGKNVRSVAVWVVFVLYGEAVELEVG